LSSFVFLYITNREVVYIVNGALVRGGLRIKEGVYKGPMPDAII